MCRRFVVFLLIGVAACSQQKPVESRDVATRDLSASAVVTRLIDGTPRNRVDVTFSAPGGTFVLAATDRLQLTVAGTTMPLTAMPGPYGTTIHRAEVPDVGGDYLLDLLRDGERSDDLDVIGAVIRVPSAFTIRLPTSDVSRRAPLTIAWDAGPGGYDITLSIAGPCLTFASRKLASDSGSYSINAAELADAGGAPTTCDAVVTIVRDATRQGPLVPDGGSLYTHATSTSAATFRSSP
jgi:hypothetical protein